MKQVPLSAFLSFSVDLDSIPEEDQQYWFPLEFRRQMMDVCGEVPELIECWKQWKLDNSDESKKWFEKQLARVEGFCMDVLASPKPDEAEKWELKVALWQLFDFLIWDNQMHSTVEDVTDWFDEFLTMLC